MRYYLERVVDISRNKKNNPETISIETSGGTITGSFNLPGCGLHLKKGDLIIRHHSPPCTTAIDKVVLNDRRRLRLRRVLGSFQSSPSIRGKYIDVRVLCL